MGRQQYMVYWYKANYSYVYLGSEVSISYG